MWPWHTCHFPGSISFLYSIPVSARLLSALKVGDLILKLYNGICIYILLEVVTLKVENQTYIFLGEYHACCKVISQVIDGGGERSMAPEVTKGWGNGLFRNVCSRLAMQRPPS